MSQHPTGHSDRSMSFNNLAVHFSLGPIRGQDRSTISWTPSLLLCRRSLSHIPQSFYSFYPGPVPTRSCMAHFGKTDHARAMILRGAIVNDRGLAVDKLAEDDDVDQMQMIRTLGRGCFPHCQLPTNGTSTSITRLVVSHHRIFSSSPARRRSIEEGPTESRQSLHLVLHSHAHCPHSC